MIKPINISRRGFLRAAGMTSLVLPVGGLFVPSRPLIIPDPSLAVWTNEEIRAYFAFKIASIDFRDEMVSHLSGYRMPKTRWKRTATVSQ